MQNIEGFFGMKPNTYNILPGLDGTWTPINVTAFDDVKAIIAR